MTATSFSPSLPAGTTSRPAGSYGSFRLGDLHLAVPMGALREIVACDTLVPLRGRADCIAGGMQRGKAVIPVLDLRYALGQATDGATAATVLLVTHEGALMGLLAHDVTGVLQGPALMPDPGTPAGRHASPLVNGHLPLGDGRNLRILSLAAVAALPKARAVRPAPVQRRRLSAWLGALARAWQRKAPAPGWNMPSAQMSGMWDTVVPGVRG